MQSVDVAIVGAGYTGAALAIELAGRLPPGSRIALIGPAGSFGRGIAYGTADPDHRLNVPAGRMSLFADDPDDFVRWLARRPDAGPRGLDELRAAFASRTAYGRYVADRLAEAEGRAGARVAIVRIEDRAIDIAGGRHGYRLELAETPPIRAARLALCLGNAPCGLPVPPTAVERAIRDRIVLDPWSEPGLSAVAPDEDALFVGTGLTMIDQVLTLERRGHRGRILAVSRRGLLPNGHSGPRPAPVDPQVPPEADLRSLVHALRARAAAVTAAGGDWQAVVDGLRPLTQALWHGLGPVDRRRFLRHVAPYWSVLRHRMAPEVAARVTRLRQAGRLEVIAGRVLGLEAAVGGGGGPGTADGGRAAGPGPEAGSRRIRAQLRRRGRSEAETRLVDRVVNCAGLDRAAVAACDPLIGALVAAGLARPDPLGLGLDVDGASRLVQRDGTTGTAYALGPLTVGRFWEIVAVPDIRVQCRDVAAALAVHPAVVD